MLGKFAFTNKTVAKNLGVPEDRVNRVMGFYIKELENEMLKCERPYIYIRKLGTFGLNQITIERRLRDMILSLRGHVKNKDIVAYAKRDKTIAALRQEIFTLFAIRRTILKRKRANYKIIDAKKPRPNHKRQLLQTDRQE